MTIDLTCPAEIVRVDLPTEEAPAAAVLMLNLSDRVIVSAEVTLRLLDGEGREQEKLTWRGRALTGRPRTAFTMNMPCTPDPRLKRAEAMLRKVWFADNAVWRADPAREREYRPNTLPVSPELAALKFAAGEDAVGFPVREPGMWICVCGRPNAEEEPACVRCGRPRELVFSRYTREAAETLTAQRRRQLELQSRSALEDTARLQRLREDQFHRRELRKRRRVRLLAAMAAAVLSTALALGVGAPVVRLWDAVRAMEGGALEEAETVFADLGSFPGAAARLAECRLRIAGRDAQESGDPETLAAAAEALRAPGAGAESAQLANEADLRRARILLEAGDFAGAREAAAGLPTGYPGLETLYLDCAYAEALDNMEKKFWMLARQGFLALGEYRDARKLADECIYRPALAMMENGEYDAAIRQFGQIPEYEDSAALIQQCWYLKGLTQERLGNLTEAADAYFAAGEWEDAAQRARALTWQAAEAAFAQADFSAAMALYGKIQDYEDSRDKYLACAYTLAKRAVKDMEYRRGLELLALLPEGYEDAAELACGAHYALGEAALEAENWQEAAEQFGAIPGYRDADELLSRAMAALSAAYTVQDEE